MIDHTKCYISFFFSILYTRTSFFNLTLKCISFQQNSYQKYTT